jgi:hypothetical protein
MMSHPDPLFDPDNAYEDDDMAYVGDEEDSNYDDYNDFYDEDDNSGEVDWVDEDINDDMDGDHESGLASCGWGTDEDYGYYGDDREDFHADDAIGYVDYNEDGPYYD